jgi:hypothetical protein
MLRDKDGKLDPAVFLLIGLFILFFPLLFFWKKETIIC